ncbi:hypothetical protein C8Q78DRAFT_1135938 [Trametes maxima]|nr:hypothetical protein C8Q78DRAFT_1135938 [Trametes maxima]
MARGNRGGRGGARGGYNPDNFRGRGRGASRGGGNGRGRGRGAPEHLDEFDFPVQQWPSNAPPAAPSFRGAVRGRGRGRGVHSLTGFSAHTPRGIPYYSRGRGRGRGEVTDTDRSQRTYGNARGLSSKLNAGAPLSKVLYADRPLLKPIIFVRSVHTAILFTEEEDIFRPVVEAAVDGDEKSHVPTADTVSRVFNPTLAAEDQLSAEEGDEVEEIDFADIGRIQAQVDAAAANVAATTGNTGTTVKETPTFFVDTTPAPVLHSDPTQQIQVNKLQGTLGDDDDDEEIIVYVAPHPRINRTSSTAPTPVAIPEPAPTRSIITGLSLSLDASAPSASESAADPVPTPGRAPAVVLELGTLYPEEPTPVPASSLHTMSPDASELPPPPSFNNVSFSFGNTTAKKQTRRLHPVGVGTPRSLLKHSRKARRKSIRGFGVYGAMHEEAELHKGDPRRAERRRGDSDLDWGTSDGEDGVEELSAGVADMEIDDSISLAAMKGFVHSMSAGGSRHVTMDDVADAEQLRKEDEDEEVRGAESVDEDEVTEDEGEGDNTAESLNKNFESEHVSQSGDEEVEAVVRAEEAELIGESDDDDAKAREKDIEGEGSKTSIVKGVDVGDVEEDANEDENGSESEEESSDDEETPRRGFRAGLERMRARDPKGKGKAKALPSSDDDSSDEAMSVQMTWADEDEDFYDSIEDILAENQHILSSHDRKAKKKLFTAIRDGKFERDMFADSMSPAKRGKNKDVPPELQEQWEKDRAKKAENKKKRALDSVHLAADPLAQRKGGKKGRKAMLAAARAADDMDLPHRVTDLVSLERQIRRFLADIGNRSPMSLPPADKETRKQVHELAGAFNLKSQSKGNGAGRYTTLIKTSMSGVGINERKIRRILKQATNGAWEGPDGGYGKGRAKATSLAKHREGEEVGKEAPKIGESNVGFKMLAAMGWADGDRIGLSGGLEAPLTAIMKKTKAGLGSTAQTFY